MLNYQSGLRMWYELFEKKFRVQYDDPHENERAECKESGFLLCIRKLNLNYVLILA